MTWNGASTFHEVSPGGESQSELVEEAVEVLNRVVGSEDALFLWTGGKEAQVVADLLLHHVGETGVSPVPFGTVDTGNHFEDMYEFREEFVAPEGDQGADTTGPFLGVENWCIERHDELLEHVIESESDPRGYHGKHRSTWKCPDCGSRADLNRQEYRITCRRCGHKSKLHRIQRQNLSAQDWGVPESCGALKVGGLRKLIERGHKQLITGVREEDPLASAGEDPLRHREERDRPKAHTRFNPLKNWSEENVWAYLKMESVSYPKLYDQGYRHTDSKCCTDDQQVSEYGEGGRNAEKEAAKQELRDMGYV